MDADWKYWREQFPALRHWTYLNTATMGHLPRLAEHAMADHLARRNELACTDFLAWFDDADRLRAKLARLFGAQPGDFCFINMANVALALLVRGIQWKPGDRLVTLDHEFPNQIYSSALLPPFVEVIETPYAEIGRFLTDGRTRLVAFSVMSYVNGFRVPLAELLPELRRRGILSYVDGTQGAGVLTQNLSELRPDIYSCHAYKWMLAPTGAGFAYVDPELRTWLEPSLIGWRSHKDWRNVDDLHHGRPEYASAAEKYEGGMLSFPLLAALDASVGMMLEIGPAAIERRALEIAAQVRSVIEQAGGEVLPGESPILAARFAGRDMSQLSRQMKESRVVLSARHGNLRVSCHFYNNEEDVARFASVLTAAAAS